MNQQCDFIRLFNRANIDEEIVIRTDSIVEIWLTGKDITILYKHPMENRLVEADEEYDAYADARQRFYRIMRIIGAEPQINEFSGTCITSIKKRAQEET